MTATEDLARPNTAAECQMEAWYMDTSDEDQRLEHRCQPNRPASAEALERLGVKTWRLDPSIYQADPQLEAIRKVRGYSYQDVCHVTPDAMPDYEAKLKMFYEEHIHADEEIRYVLDGSGYFDVRDFEDQWIRIKCLPGDMLVLPAGIYHRFTLDEQNYIKAMRLFVGEPVWTPHNRPQESHPARVQYMQQYTSGPANEGIACQ